MASIIKALAAPALALVVTVSPLAGDAKREIPQREGAGPAGFAAFESDYAPRVDFGARLEPAVGVIHGAGQDPDGVVRGGRLGRIHAVRGPHGILPG